MSQTFHREYLLRLPLPLAQLYSRAHNATDPRGRHDNTFYLFEALIKLTAAPAIVEYLNEVERGAARSAVLDKLLLQLALPSLGQWLAMLRELARRFGARPDAASHPLGHLWPQLTTPRRDLPGVLALYRRIKNGPDASPAGDQSCSVLQLLEALVQYRNAVFGHGAARLASFYEREMGPLLFPAANEVLAENTLDMLGPRGSRLVYLTDLRALDDGRAEIGIRELVGREGERAAALQLPMLDVRGLAPNRIAVIWPGRMLPLCLDPLLVYREGELSEEVLFVNRDRDGRQVEYLSYTTGRTERDRATGAALAALLSRAAGQPVSEGQLPTLADQSRADTPALEANVLSSPETATRLGDFEVLAEIGRGGMGVVYLARQLSLGRLVALKMLPAELAGDAAALARFRREIRALARCDHANIVKVLASGSFPDGRLYYAMEYVPGCDLELVWRELSGSPAAAEPTRLGGSTWTEAVLAASRKRRQQAVMATTTAPRSCEKVAERSAELPPLPELSPMGDEPGGYVRRVVRMMHDAALALQAVHDQRLIHRDVKPANLMLTPDGARVVLMDFGLAKGKSLATSATRAGGLLGTLRYAAPEQLASATLEVGPAADVRGLGVTLWELLTRRRLFADAQDEAQLAQMVHEEDVPRLRGIDRGFDADLEAIVARATERRVADRIPRAERLAEYLQLYLDGKPLPIRPPRVRELAWRWMRRRKAVLAATGVVLAALVLAAWLAIAQLLQHRVLRRGATADLEEAAGLRQQGHYPEARAVLKRVEARLAHGDFAEMKQQLAQADQDVDMAARLEEIPLLQMEMISIPGAGQLGLPTLNKEEMLKAYRETFRNYGIDLDALEREEAAARVRGSAIREQLLAALNHWAGQETTAAERERLLSLADRADDDPLRSQVRDAVRRKDRTALKALVAKLEVGSLPPSSIQLLGVALTNLGAAQEGGQFVRQGQRAHPADFLLLLFLGTGFSHETPEQRADKIGFLRAAVAVRPDSGLAHFALAGLLGSAPSKDAMAEAELREARRLRPEDRYGECILGLLLASQNKRTEGEAVFRAALQRWPDDPLVRLYFIAYLIFVENKLKEAEQETRSLLSSSAKVQLRWQKIVRSYGHGLLGVIFSVQKKWKEAEAEFRECRQLLPDRSEFLTGLGLALMQQHKVEEAAETYRQMLRLKLDDPDVRKVTSWLSGMLFKQGKLKEMEELLRQAVRRWPDDPELRYTLGGCLAIYKPQEAEAELQEAIRLRRDYAEAYYRLGLVRVRHAKYAEAESAFRAVLRLKPDDPDATYQLGTALYWQKQFDEAAVVFRAFLRLRPDDRDGHYLLGNVLAVQGHLQEALTEFARVLKAFPSNAPQRKAVRGKQELFQRLFERDAELPDWLRKRPLPADAGETLDWARLCRMPVKRWYRTAVRYYSAAFVARPALAEDLPQGQRYNAACAAALAGCGEGADVSGMDDRERARLRRQGLAWLRADLAARQRQADSGSAARQEVQQEMARWRRDNDLAGVRDPKPLGELPEEERKEWRQFWSDVDVLASRLK